MTGGDTDQARWTVVHAPDAKYDDIAYDGHRLWGEACDALPQWLAYEAWDALVALVRDHAARAVLGGHTVSDLDALLGARMDVLAEAHSWLSLNADPDAVEADGAVTPSAHLIRDLKHYAEELAAALRDHAAATRERERADRMADALREFVRAARAALGDTP